MTAIHNLAELREVAFQVLVRELGYANAVRFMLQYERGRGDYSRERARLLPDLSVEDWLRDGEEQTCGLPAQSARSARKRKTTARVAKRKAR